MLHENALSVYIERLHDMIAKIERYTSHISSYEEFISDERNIDMVIPPLTQI
jgi:uncharacterized protein with HEPN domain